MTIVQTTATDQIGSETMAIEAQHIISGRCIKVATPVEALARQ
jgi:hypothetical protein